MTDEPQDSTKRRDPAAAGDASAARDAGLRRVGHTTRWIAAGATALTGAFAGVAWQVTPGRATATTPTSQRSAATSSARVQQNDGTFGSAQGLAPPAQVPRSAAGPPAAASGAS
jgi:hypothetical protein